MKKSILILLVVFFSFGFDNSAAAQGSQGDVFIEGGLGYGSKIESLAIQTGVGYTINEEFRVMMDGIFFLPGKDVRGLSFSWLEFNANGHYLFQNQENTLAYALAGLSFSSLFSDHSKIELPSGDKINTLYTGLNIGLGAEFPVGVVNLYAEGKYTLGIANHLALTGGIRVPILQRN